MNLWKETPGMCEEIPTLTPYIPSEKTTDAAVIIFAGGAYMSRAIHEGEGYGKFFQSFGMTAFVVDYRVSPHTFPLPLLDARRAVRYVRAHAEEYGIDPQKIAAIGSSAGGHLVASLCTYREELPFEGMDDIDEQPYLPNAQILCYPVICAPDKEGICHKGSYWYLLGEVNPQKEQSLDPERNVTAETPQAFIWHTAEDQAVNVINSYRYAAALREHNVPVELHVFPHGPHGMGLAGSVPHVAQWTKLLKEWLSYLGW